MKKLILFISLTLAFSASFAGVKSPPRVSKGLIVKCIHDNQIANIKTSSPSPPYKYNTKTITPVSVPGSYRRSLCSNSSCIIYSVMLREDYKKEAQNPHNYFQSYMDVNYFNKYIELNVEDPSATCGDTGKKIKPVTITKIKRFHPIILETLE